MSPLFILALSALVILAPLTALAAETETEEPSAPPDEQAELSVKTDPPGAVVAVDSMYIGASPAYGLVLPAVEYSVGVYLDGCIPLESVVVLKSGEKIEMEFVLSRGPESGWFSIANFLEGVAIISGAIALTIAIGLSTADWG
ncbi:MAG: PEGA domain-containing protein [Candidatus Coatesbacteria bacterium]|nr:MAG: PEGA domain-containing protein [Candidatus Coatesbacteria bacterium]